MFEKKSFNELTYEIQSLYEKNPLEKLLPFHEVLNKLTELDPGNYMLSKKFGSLFAELLKSESK